MGYERKVVESFTNMKARIGVNKLLTIHLQCEDLHCKVRSKITQKERGGGTSWQRKVLPKLRTD